MIISENEWLNSNDFESDIVIVGAGAAGISMALEFDRLGRHVILLEGGGAEFSQESQELYSGESHGVPLPYGLRGSRFRYFGGSTNCWGGGCGELDEEDFVSRDWVGLSGWPITKDDLRPWYKKAESFLNVTGPVSDPQGYANTFKTLPGLETKCLTPTPIVRFNVEFATDLKNSENIKLILGANCTDIVRLPDSNSVDHLIIKSFSGGESRVRGMVFVLACGGIENARILLNAYEQSENSLAINENTGRYFSDHPIAPCATILGYQNSNDQGDLDVTSIMEKNPGKSVPLPYYKLPFEIQKQYGVLNGAVQFIFTQAELTASASAAWRLRNWAKGNTATLKLDDVKAVLSDPLSVFKAISQRSDGRFRLAMRFQIEQSPNKSSRVELSSERDYFGLKKTKLNWQFSDIERKTVDVLNYYVAKTFAAEDLGLLKLDVSIQKNALSMPSDLRGGQHHSGATRMSVSPQLGVVDSDLKVFGLDNLFVTGSSVFPTNGWVNPTFSIIALSLRLTSHLDSLFRRKVKA